MLLCVRYPESNAYTRDAVLAAAAESSTWHITTSPSKADLQFSDYDLIDWSPVANGSVASCYVIRKALIRKNYLALTVQQYVAKHPDSVLVNAVPRTYAFELAYADDLDELWFDELYELGQSLVDVTTSWWMFKPAMSDKGDGIRLFSCKQDLVDIVESMEGNEEGLTLSDLRHFVIQAYVEHPLLLCIPQIEPQKFHLRAYVLCIGALQVYLYDQILALFAAEAYEDPEKSCDLRRHLTNTCLQDDGTAKTANVRLLDDLSGFSQPCGRVLTADDVSAVKQRMTAITRDLFTAALSSGPSFQPLPNCFEIFGVDFLLQDNLQLHLLEVNACPDFQQTGQHLQAVVQSLVGDTLRLVESQIWSKPPLHRELGLSKFDAPLPLSSRTAFSQLPLHFSLSQAFNMLTLGGIQAWIQVDGQEVDEVSMAQCGELCVGLIQATENKLFSVRFYIPDQKSDFSCKAIIDGRLTASRALSKREKHREASISSTPLTTDGSKSLPFGFAKSDVGTNSKNQTPSNGEIGTIQLIIHRCELEEIAVGSERRAVPANLPTLSEGYASHFTRLDAVKFEPSRRAYRCKKKDPDAWITFRWVYGNADFLAKADLKRLLVPEALLHTVTDITAYQWFQAHAKTASEPNAQALKKTSSTFHFRPRSASTGHPRGIIEATKHDKPKHRPSLSISSLPFASLFQKNDNKKHKNARLVESPPASARSFASIRS